MGWVALVGRAGMGSSATALSSMLGSRACDFKASL